MIRIVKGLEPIVTMDDKYLPKDKAREAKSNKELLKQIRYQAKTIEIEDTTKVLFNSDKWEESAKQHFVYAGDTLKFTPRDIAFITDVILRLGMEEEVKIERT